MRKLLYVFFFIVPGIALADYVVTPTSNGKVNIQKTIRIVEISGKEVDPRAEIKSINEQIDKNNREIQGYLRDVAKLEKEIETLNSKVMAIENLNSDAQSLIQKISAVDVVSPDKNK